MWSDGLPPALDRWRKLGSMSAHGICAITPCVWQHVLRLSIGTGLSVQRLGREPETLWLELHVSVPAHARAERRLAKVAVRNAATRHPTNRQPPGCPSPCAQDMQRPLYMRPRDALEYGIIDEIIEPDQDKKVRHGTGDTGQQVP